METKLERIVELSAKSSRPEFASLYYLINKEMLSGMLFEVTMSRQK